MNLRRDHAAGGAFIVAGAFVLAVSGDLPFGTLASPGAGMLPRLLATLMMVFGLALVLRAGTSPPLAELNWSDLPHAVRVGVLAVAAVVAFEPLGFAVTTALLLFVLIFWVERSPLLPALGFSIAAPLVVYVLFSVLLRTPLPRGLLGF
ncbi:MAG: tripartite tricarboxylate transporter TctB family protein [Hyphomicrobiaceae bacterium]|nr:tripartite tricarboxylate transporter TctB family protein [Hyphomicrobiaceae bacterium]